MKIRKQAFLLIALIASAMLLIASHPQAGTHDLSASASCAANSSSASISISGDMYENESYSGSGSAEADVGDGYSSSSESGTISVKCVRRSFLWWSWLSTESKSVSASAYVLGFFSSYGSSASAEASAYADLATESCSSP